MAAEFDAGFHIPLLVSRLELEASRPVGAFEEYGVDARRASSILARMSSWATRLRSEAEVNGSHLASSDAGDSSTK
ncbi:MAG: hypothetical protein JJE28_07920 [Actinomycetales bacterium]|nr:hypothetical protein [Actinomycetales bacterium]